MSICCTSWEDNVFCHGAPLESPRVSCCAATKYFVLCAPSWRLSGYSATCGGGGDFFVPHCGNFLGVWCFLGVAPFCYTGQGRYSFFPGSL